MRLYFASKMKHAEKWRKFALDNPRHHIVSRWHYLEPFVPDTPDHAKNFWAADFLDVLACDALIVYAEKGEHLCGALIEAGFALGNSKPVYVVGEHPSYGTWQHFPGVKKITLEMISMNDFPK